MGSDDGVDEPWARFDEVVAQIVDRPLGVVRADVGVEVAKVLTELNQFRTRISGLRNEVSEIRKEVDRLPVLLSTTRAIETGLSDLADRVGEVAGAIEAQSSRIGALERHVDESVHAAREAITARIGLLSEDARDERATARHRHHRVETLLWAILVLVAIATGLAAAIAATR